MSHHDRKKEGSESASMAGLAFVQEIYRHLQALLDWQPPAPVTMVAGIGGAGGGDDGDDHSHTEKFEQELQFKIFFLDF